MKKIQRFLCGTALLAVLSLLVSATAFAASVPDPTSDFYVNDYVGVLSAKMTVCIMLRARRSS